MLLSLYGATDPSLYWYQWHKIHLDVLDSMLISQSNSWSSVLVLCCLCSCACLSEELFRCCRRPPPHTGMKWISPRHGVIPENSHEWARRLLTGKCHYPNKIRSFCKNWQSFRFRKLDSIDTKNSTKYPQIQFKTFLYIISFKKRKIFRYKWEKRFPRVNT